MPSKDRLFTVTATFTYVIEADSLMDAQDKAHNYVRDAFGDLSLYDIDCDVDEGIPTEGWYDECIPYGGDGNARTGEYK